MRLNFGVLPFSYAGSYLAFSYPQDDAVGYEHDLTLRILHGMFNDQDNFPIFFVDEKGERLAGEIVASETELRMVRGAKILQLCFQNEKVVYFRSNAAIVITKRRLSGLERVMDHGKGEYEIAGYDGSLVIALQQGRFFNKSRWGKEGVGISELWVEIVPDQSDRVEGQLILSGLSYEKPKVCSYEKARRHVEQQYQAFKEKFHTNLPEYKDILEETAYINWHSIVAPQGYVKYPVMLMSKNKMNQVWSWDYAINALAMVDKEPELAYGQFLAMAACQDESGFYADCFQARTKVTGFVKPPVQGFILRRMFQISRPDQEVIERLYQSVAAFTRWWFQYRSRDGGSPEYYHGNDSGWDNSTVFSEGVPVKSPDLCAWLIEQTDFLGETAEELGYEKEAAFWQEKSSWMLDLLLKEFVRDNRFVAYKEPEHRIVKGRSLILYIPLILGRKLPKELRISVLQELLEEEKYVTRYGIASEPLDSDWFIEDGYWRGAIWPPVAFIMTEILVRNGKREEALENAKKFCDLCAREGFYENYSALDGHGLRDSGFTWTASAFVILLRDYIEREDL